MKVLLDSYAWIEYFMGTEKGKIVKDELNSDKVLYTSPIVIAEIYSKSVRVDGIEKAEERKNFIIKRCIVISIEEDIATAAGKIHGETKASIKDFGLADAFILATARKIGAKVLTGDPHFKNFEESIML